MTHNVKVYSVLADKAHSSPVAPRSRNPAAPDISPDRPEWDRTLAAANRYLTSIAAEARRKAPTSVGKFTGLVFSLGGIVEVETGRQLQAWKEVVGEAVWSWTMRRVAVGLVKARARTWS